MVKLYKRTVRRFEWAITIHQIHIIKTDGKVSEETKNISTSIVSKLEENLGYEFTEVEISN